MQNELDAEGFEGKIEILGVNGAGYEAASFMMYAGRELPWLEDTEAASVWTSWAVTYRDVVILDGENRPIGVYNLTEHNLTDPANFSTLKGLLMDAASP
ncbi:MAG: hypothetical protein IT372_32600 [Polyangiaceae bacterium]|nr:hypothetical protein [Polyangiaceae bacterium]